ncbi:MAG: hypothetical protein SFU98_10940 [Leptospiraceae bacterium]|nr:hypothetical protein [Leptospiraceae bacterium]
MISKKIIFLLLLSGNLFSIFSNEVSDKRFNLTGSVRFRSFSQSRDISIGRVTPNFPVIDFPSHYEYLAAQNNALVQTELQTRAKGQPSTLSKKRESNQFFDSRILLNLEFNTSQYFDGVVGVQVGDVVFGGRGLNPALKNNTDPYLIGPGSGGELGQGGGTNLQMNLMYLNFRLRQYNFYMRTGIQLFSSIQGRVLFSACAGVFMNKDFKQERFSLEGGWIRARERTLADIDSNGFNDRNNQNVNIFFYKLKVYRMTNLKNELYSYYSKDNDVTDTLREIGDLFWHGLFNEFTMKNYSIIVHGVYNHGRVSAINPLKDSENNLLYEKRNYYSISGALYDIQFTYFYNNNINFNLIGVGTTGRPGVDKDGVPGAYKNGGYRTLAPGFAVSNIALDFTGGYALFNATNMSGLNEIGGFVNVIAFGAFQLTFGYYQLYASRTPRLSVNRDFNSLFGNNSSPYIGDEYNLNFRWSILSDFQIIFRSGHFNAGRGYKAITDQSLGTYAREAFLSAEYRF